MIEVIKTYPLATVISIKDSVPIITHLPLIYREEGTFEQARELESHFEEAIHSLADHPRVTDVRNFGLMGGVDLQPRAGEPGMRGLDIHKTCFWEEDMVIRNSGDLLQFSPFLNASPDDISRTFEVVRKVLDRVD